MTLVCLWFLLTAAWAGAGEQDPPPELLKNLEFFMNYGLVKNLELLESPVSGQDVRASTAAARAPALEVKSSTAAVGGKR